MCSSTKREIYGMQTHSKKTAIQWTKAQREIGQGLQSKSLFPFNVNTLSLCDVGLH